VGDLWESNGSLDELIGSFSDDILVWNNDGLDNVDGFSSGAVSTSHLGVHGRDGTAKSVGSVFLVHVDDTCS